MNGFNGFQDINGQRNNICEGGGGGGSDLCGSIIAEGIVQIYCVCFLRFPELHQLQAYLDLHVQQIMFGYLGIMDNTYIQNYPIKSG